MTNEELVIEYQTGNRSVIEQLYLQNSGTIDNDSMVILQQYAGILISNIPVYRCKKALFLCSIRRNTGKSCFLNLL